MLAVPHTKYKSHSLLLKSDEMREDAGLRQDAISSQLSTRSRRKEIKETGHEKN